MSDVSLLAEENIGLAYHCALKFKDRGIELDDLRQAACEGLLKAAHNFDAARGVAFSTYAVPVIMGEIKALFRKEGSLKASRRLKENALQISRYICEYEKCFGASPGVNEISERLGLTREDVLQALEYSAAPLPLVRGIDEHGVADIPVKDHSDQSIARMDLAAAVAELGEQERKLFVLRYIKCQTQSAAAAQLGISQVSVSRKERKMEEKLQKVLSIYKV